MRSGKWAAILTMDRSCDSCSLRVCMLRQMFRVVWSPQSPDRPSGKQSWEWRQSDLHSFTHFPISFFPFALSNLWTAYLSGWGDNGWVVDHAFPWRGEPSGYKCCGRGASSTNPSIQAPFPSVHMSPLSLPLPFGLSSFLSPFWKLKEKSVDMSLCLWIFI